MSNTRQMSVTWVMPHLIDLVRNPHQRVDRNGSRWFPACAVRIWNSLIRIPDQEVGCAGKSHF